MAQVLLDRQLKALAHPSSNGADGSDARTIIFTDSRDDAAETAAGVELNHFRDLVRQLAIDQLSNAESPVDLLRRAAEEMALNPAEETLVAAYKAAAPDAWAGYRARRRGVEDDKDLKAISEFEKVHGGDSGALPWNALLLRIAGAMVKLGSNPAGPASTAQKYLGHPWWEFFEPPSQRFGHPGESRRGRAGLTGHYVAYQIILHAPSST